MAANREPTMSTSALKLLCYCSIQRSIEKKLNDFFKINELIVHSQVNYGEKIANSSMQPNFHVPQNKLIHMTRILYLHAVANNITQILSHSHLPSMNCRIRIP